MKQLRTNMSLKKLKMCSPLLKVEINTFFEIEIIELEGSESMCNIQIFFSNILIHI